MFFITVTKSAAFGAFGKSFAPHMNRNEEMVLSGLEFLAAIGADKGRIHQGKVAHQGDNCNRDRNDVPRGVIGRAKPVDLAGAKSESAHKCC